MSSSPRARSSSFSAALLSESAPPSNLTPVLDVLRREEAASHQAHTLRRQSTITQRRGGAHHNPFAVPEEEHDSTEHGTYQPPAIPAAMVVEVGDVFLPDEWQGRAGSSADVAATSASSASSASAATVAALPAVTRDRHTSYAAYSFSANTDERKYSNTIRSGEIPMTGLDPPSRNRSTASHPTAAPHDSAASGGDASPAAEDDADMTSATDLERQALVRVDHDPHASSRPKPLLQDYAKSTSSIRKDFTTVDWFFSKSNMHRVRRLLRDANKENGRIGKIRNLLYSGEAWFILCIAGIATALTASVIHSVSAWLSDLKGGYCSGHNLFCTRRVCCMDEQTPGTVCTSWKTWSQAIGHEGQLGGTIFSGIMYMLFATIFATCGSWVCVVYARQAAGSGIAELKIMLGGFIIKKFLGIRTLFFKTIGLTLAVASGMALGKEGPMVHIACAWGNILSRPFLKYRTNEVKKAEILAASVAGGVTAAFGSPLGGVLFSLEVVASYFPPKTMWRAFWCAICTALILQSIDPFQTGKLVQFAIEINKWQWFELVPMAALGAMGGMLGALFIKLNVKVSKIRKGTPWIRANPVGEVAVLALLTAILSFPNIFMRGNSGALLAQLFSNCNTMNVAADDDQNAGPDSVINALCEHDDSPWINIGWLLLATILKFLLTTVTYGSSIPSGVFMPTLCVGACLGRIVGWLMLKWHLYAGDHFIFAICSGKTNCINPALYAVIGAASVLGGVTRMTVSLAVIMFEVTGGLDIIVPIMVGVVCAKWFGDAFGRASLYGQLIELNGLPHIDPHSELDLFNPCADCMSADPICLSTYGETLDSIRELLAHEVYHGFPVIDNPHDRLITGFIARGDLEYEMEKIQEQETTDPKLGTTRVHFSKEPPPFPHAGALDFSTNVDRHPIQVRPSMPVDRIMSLFQALGLRYVLCCSPRGRVLGIVKKKSLLLFLASKHIHHK